MLLPVTLLLIGMGVIGFLYAQKSILDQWGEAVILKLQRAAHRLDMQLHAPKALLELYGTAVEGSDSESLQKTIMDHLGTLSGVARVEVELAVKEDAGFSPHVPQGGLQSNHHRMRDKQGKSMPVHRARIRGVSLPRYDDVVHHETVSMISELIDRHGEIIGTLEVVFRLHALLEALKDQDVSPDIQAIIVDDNGRIVTSSINEKRSRLGETQDPLELRVLQALHQNAYGTLWGRGYPPEKIIGFYRLEEAPWTLVAVSPGKRVLEPILQFRNYYLLIAAAFILFILVLIRWITGQTVSSIKEVSHAAKRLSAGHYDKPLPVRTRDEVGELIRSFNSMVEQLEERSKIKKALDLAMEVQQNLLPRKNPCVEGLDIAGKSLYCDETGGDYYDFFFFGGKDRGKIGIVVGDVSEHGIPSALLMATARAFLRQCSARSEPIATIVSDVNIQLAKDMEDSGRFMTLFYMTIDPDRKRIEWVRAGHDPAILYDPVRDTFFELKGPGLALGVDPGWKYTENHREDLTPGQVIVIGTDGIWEAQNPAGERYGKAPLLEAVRLHHSAGAKSILDAIIEDLNRFLGDRKPEDDATVVVIRVDPR